MSEEKDMNYEEIKTTCRNTFAFMENMCRQAHMEIDVIDGTDFNHEMAEYFCKKSLLFADFITSSLKVHCGALRDAQGRLGAAHTTHTAVKRVNRLSLKRTATDADTQDTFSDEDGPDSHDGNNVDSLFLEYLNLTPNKAPACNSLECTQIKSEPDDYERFEDKKDIDAIIEKLLANLFCNEEGPREPDERSTGGSRAASDCNDCDVDFKEDARCEGHQEGDVINSSTSRNDSEEELSLEEQRRIHLNAIREMENLGYSTSDLVTSSDVDSDETESEENIPVRRNPHPIGEEVHIETDILLDIINSDPIETLNGYREEFHLKECTVALQDLRREIVTNRSVHDKELAEIERLANLSSLDKKKSSRMSSSESECEARPKRRKIRKSSRGSVKFSDSTDEDSDCPSPTRRENLNGLEPVAGDEIVPKIDSEKVMLEILTYGFGDSDVSEREVSTSDDTEILESETESMFNETEVAPRGNAKEQNKETNVDPELLLRKKWRRDSLLTGKLTDSSSSDDDDDVKEVTAHANGNVAKRKRVEFVDVSDVDKSNPIALSSDSENSDVEFVKVVSSKRPRKRSDAEDDDEVKKGGRRNIRAVKSDEALEEATKLAAKEEGDRAQRILLKQRNLDEVLSQTSTELLQGLVLDLDEKANEPIVSVDLQLTNKLKPHQREGVRFMWNTCYESVIRSKSYEGTGCILAHCMGLGKTLQVITLVHTLFTHPATSTRHVLIVCPLSTVLNWEYEFKIALDDLPRSPIRRFCISNRKTDKEYRFSIVEEWLRGSGVLILGYEAYQTLVKLVPENPMAVLTEKQQHVKEALCDPGPDLVICDEGHLLKNGKNNRTKSLMKIRTKRRIILTGTPLQNNLIEYYYMVKFVKPNLLGSLAEYSNRFVNPITNGQYDDSTPADIQLMRKRSHVLHKILNQTVQRYEVTELKNYLPEMTDYAVNVLLHPVQVALYKAYLERVYDEDRGRVKKLFYDFNNLRNVWTHPYLLCLVERHKAQLDKKTKLEVDTINLESVDLTIENEIAKNDEFPRGWWKELCSDDFETNIDYGPKFKVLFGILDECERADDKVLVFSNSLAELDCIEYFLKTIGTSCRRTWRRKEHYLRMDGTVPPDTRMKYCNYFNNPANAGVRVFLISHRVGGLGLNLVAANRVVLMDVNFNPAYDLQSIFRIYRFGQRKHCYVYRLVAKGTMEEVNYERSITKLAVSGRVIDQLQIPRHYKSSDLQKMYRFKEFTKDSIEPYGTPTDDVLAKVLQSFNTDIHSFHEHQSLLENLTEEVLNETEMKKAWEEFNEEKQLKRWDRERGPEHLQAGRNSGPKTPDDRSAMKPPDLPGDAQTKTQPHPNVARLLYAAGANDSSAAHVPPVEQQVKKKQLIFDRTLRFIVPPLAATPGAPACAQQKENVEVINVENADLLKQISCNNSLTLSTVLVEQMNKEPVTEKNYENVIEID